MEFSVPVRVAPCQTRSMPEEVGYYVANHRLGRVGVRLEVQHPVMLRWGQGLTCAWRLCRCLRVLRWTGYLDRIEVELSESSAAPANDTHTGAGDSPDHQKVGPSPTALPAVPNLIRLSTPPTPPTSRPSIPSGTPDYCRHHIITSVVHDHAAPVAQYLGAIDIQSDQRTSKIFPAWNISR